jgi:hypothetical protein
MAAAPLAPAAVSLSMFALGIGAACVFVLLLGLRWTWQYTIGAILEALADVRINLPGRHDLHPLRWLRAYNVAVQNNIEGKLERSHRAMGYFFHGAAIIMEWTAREIAGLAADTLHFGQSLTHVRLPRLTRAMIIAAFPLPWLARRVAALIRAHAVHAARTVVTRVERTVVHRVTRIVAATAGAVAVPMPWLHVFPRLRNLGKQIGRTRKQIRRLERLLTASGAVALVAVALRSMDLQWLRCRSLSKLGKRIGCGGFAVMEMLMAGTMEAFVLSDLCRFTSLLTAATEKLRPALLQLVDVEQALVGCHGNTAPAVLHMPPLDIPPVVGVSSLAA